MNRRNYVAQNAVLQKLIAYLHVAFLLSPMLIPYIMTSIVLVLPVSFMKLGRDMSGLLKHSTNTVDTLLKRR